MREAFPRAMKRDCVSDARSHRRLGETPMLVSYTIGDDFAPAHTETYDIGLGGLALLSSIALPLGTELSLQLELKGQDRPPLILKGEVRWCREDTLAGRYRIGVEFTTRDAEQDAQLVGYIDTVYKLRDLGVL